MTTTTDRFGATPLRFGFVRIGTQAPERTIGADRFAGETDIPSTTIGEIVMESLARIDTVAYVRFASVYKNFQAADDFDKFVSELRPPAKDE